jgi:hypothetical protein
MGLFPDLPDLMANTVSAEPAAIARANHAIAATTNRPNLRKFARGIMDSPSVEPFGSMTPFSSIVEVQRR